MIPRSYAFVAVPAPSCTADTACVYCHLIDASSHQQIQIALTTSQLSLGFHDVSKMRFIDQYVLEYCRSHVFKSIDPDFLILCWVHKINDHQ